MFLVTLVVNKVRYGNWPLTSTFSRNNTIIACMAAVFVWISRSTADSSGHTVLVNKTQTGRLRVSFTQNRII